MGFVYFKPMSLEQVFSFLKNNKNGNYAEKGTNISIFNGFNYNDGMTLKEFEEKNHQRYQEYEMAATEAWAQKNLDNPIEDIREQAYKMIKEHDDKLNERIEKAVDKYLTSQEILDNAVKKMAPAPKFGLDEEPTKEEYVEPDPTMCRDSKTHDW